LALSSLSRRPFFQLPVFYCDSVLLSKYISDDDDDDDDVDDKIIITRMWANAQRDGRPAEYRWRPMFNAAKFG